jgi:hypothetical protein
MSGKPRTARAGQQEQDCQNKTSKTGHREKGIRNRIVGTGQIRQDRLNMTEGHDRKDRELGGKELSDRTARQ